MTASAPLRVIMGPTAAGKSAVAMHLAERFGLAIISADSRQLYRGFDIGTAKPSLEDRARILHYGLDVLDPMERGAAPRWAQWAQQWIESAQGTGRASLIVGGTGFYIRALTHPLAEAPELDPGRRAQLERVLSQLDGDELARWCRRLDPARAHLGRVQRLRAVETALLAGARLSDAHAREEAHARPVPAVRYLLVDPGPALASRIVSRVRAMMAAGWPDEVAALRSTISPDAPAWNASGYGAMRAAVTGACTMAEAMERIVIETRQYAKRQRTWNRHQLPADAVTVIDSGDASALARAEAWWRDRGENT